MTLLRSCLAVFIAGGILASAAFPADVPQVVAQQQLGENACGPCAFLNSIEQGRDTISLRYLAGQDPLEKARDFLQRFGKSPSIAYGPRRASYSDKTGIADVDLLSMINQMRKIQHLQTLKGEYLTRSHNESPAAFTQRVHRLIQGSIDAGFPPLLSIRSVKAQDVWNTITGHWVCVANVSQTNTDEPLLLLQMADSLSGKIIEGLLYHEPRPAKVPMKFTVNAVGKEVWQWEDSSNCLFLSAPSLALGTDRAKCNERTYIAARYLIYRDTSMK